MDTQRPLDLSLEEMQRTRAKHAVIGEISCYPGREYLAAPWPHGQSRRAMRQLLLLRHAKSCWDDPGLSDHARPLARRGLLAAAAMRRAMQELGLQPDLVLVSSARRTLQTLQALEPWEEMPLIEPMDGLYLAGAEQLLKALRGTPETVRSAMLIGHNPGLHELAVMLVGAHGMTLANESGRRLASGYPSGALAEFTVAAPWQRLGEGTGRLVHFVCPKDLPEAV